MLHEEFYKTTPDNLKLYFQIWKPEKEPHTVINLVHGQGEHSTRYDHWAERFVERGYAVFTFDHRGHGKSDGKPGYAASYQNYLDDTELLMHESETKFPNTPKIIYGHSMGGNIVLNYLLKYKPDVKLAIVTSPWLRLSMEVPKILTSMAKVIDKLFPKITQNTNLKAENLTSDPEQIEKVSNDPFNYGKCGVRIYLGIEEAGKWALENADKHSVKTILMHGTGDKITSHKASEEYAAKAGDIVHLKFWDKQNHELHNEKDRSTFFDYLIDWIEKN